MSFSDYRGLKKQITAIRKAQQRRSISSTTNQHDELGLESGSSEGSQSHSQSDLVRLIDDPVSSSSRHDPDVHAAAPTKRTLFQTPLPSRGAPAHLTSRGAKTDMPNEPLVGESTGMGRMLSLRGSMSALRRRQNSQAGGEHHLI